MKARSSARPGGKGDELSLSMTRNPARQATLVKSVTAAGRGLHTGRNARVTLHPAPADTGLRFRRLDGAGTAMEVPALWSHRAPATLCTALRFPDGKLLRTVEHLLASLFAFGVDNLVVEVEGEELPIFDGSALPWCRLLLSVGLIEQAEPRRAIRVLEPVEWTGERRSLRIEPAERLSVDVTIDLAGFGDLRWEGTPEREVFLREIAPARSFGRLKWALPAMLFGTFHGQPVLRGARLNNVALLWGKRVLGGARVPEEPVRHRALDLIGDLALAGAPLLGRVIAHRPGHDYNYALLEKLMRTPGAYEWVSLG
jgi:UDP-3-O-[3-hydroxymyristoyl] N-acetylglucosamine deacetylase